MTDNAKHKPNDPSFLTNVSNEHLPWWERLAAEDYGGRFGQFLTDTWQANKSMVVLAGIVVLGVAVSAGLLLNQQSTDMRSQASVSNGPAIIMLSPTGSNLAPGTKQTINVTATTGSRPVVGFQLVMTFSGAVPSDLQFVPGTLPNFQVVRNSLANKRLEFMYLLPPSGTGITPFSTQAPVTLGSLQFTAPRKGTMTVEFSAQETLIADFETNQDISRAPAATRYNFKR
jgi:hypothetical protein